MNWNILITRRIPDAGIDFLRQHDRDVEVGLAERPMTAAELDAAAVGRHGLLIQMADRITGEFLDAHPTVRAISTYAVGFDNIDVPACTARRVGVANTAHVLTDATAEIAWTLMMACARRAIEGDQLVRAGRWEGWGPLQLLGQHVTGKTLGIVGAGRIGQRVAEMSRGFRMPLLYCSRNPNARMEHELHARRVDLPTLLAAADFVSLHVPLTAHTRHLIGPAQLAAMKPTAILINTARGPVVDETALLHALQSRQIFAAGLDVYENEPRLTPGLAELPNVVLLPHLGSGTTETRQRMSLLAAENLLAMLEGQRPPSPVNPELWP